MAALIAFLCALLIIASLVLASLTHAFTQDERDHRQPHQPEVDR